MSYTISISKSSIPANDDLAWNHLENIYNNECGSQIQDFIELINKLTANDWL
jgi:hypothetical protein